MQRPPGLLAKVMTEPSMLVGDQAEHAVAGISAEPLLQVS